MTPEPSLIEKHTNDILKLYLCLSNDFVAETHITLMLRVSHLQSGEETHFQLVLHTQVEQEQQQTCFQIKEQDLH